jgi:uncharacterized protein YgbK (DUF1537 family)
VWTRIIADDLTGACDVGAALHGLGVPVMVESIDARAVEGVASRSLVVRNTQSRTLAPADAAARVRRALAGVPRGGDGLVLKKIDTALRGPLGAEIDAAMEAVGAALAIVLPAIPEVGRTTVGGRQLHEGVPVDETAFARDPQNPIRDCRVGAVIGATSRRRIGGIPLDAVRGGHVADAIARRRAGGAGIVVGDAETDADLARWTGAIGELMRHDGVDPLVLVGSTGLARACCGLPRSWLSSAERGAPAIRLADAPAGIGVLVVSGSAHPATRAQLDDAERAIGLATICVDLGAPVASGESVARTLGAGGIGALVAPSGEIAGGSEALLDAVATAAAAALARVRPRALVLVGGETAFALLAKLGHPRLAIDRPAPMPLVAHAVMVDGAAAGTVVITKGGSTGAADRLRLLVEEARR